MTNDLDSEYHAAELQERYRKRRRDRALGYSIDHSLQCVRNIIVSCDQKNWKLEELEFVSDVKSLSEDALVILMKIERKLDALCDIYATAVAPWENQDLKQAAIKMDPYKESSDGKENIS